MNNSNRKSVLINATNLHVGGGVQVATSFVYELQCLLKSNMHLDMQIYVAVSSRVHDNLSRLGCDVDVFDDYFVCDNRGVGAIFSMFFVYFRRFDVVFTVFGPLYSIVLPRKHICGFAQPRLIYDYENMFALNYFDRVLSRMKGFIQLALYMRCDKIIVELEHVKERLVSKGVPRDTVAIVRNCVNGVFFNKQLWSARRFNIPSDKIAIGILSRNYVHKNIDTLPFVKSILYSKYKMDLNFIVTFSDDEWGSKAKEFRDGVINVGAVSVDECPAFYKQIDAVIFPSLLECFSATPLEALIMKKPLFASDRRFVRDVCGDYCVYFDPCDPHDIARVVFNYINDFGLVGGRRVDEAYEYAVSLPGASDRVNGYMGEIAKCLE